MIELEEQHIRTHDLGEAKDWRVPSRFVHRYTEDNLYILFANLLSALVGVYGRIYMFYSHLYKIKNFYFIYFLVGFYDFTRTKFFSNTCSIERNCCTWEYCLVFSVVSKKNLSLFLF